MTCFVYRPPNRTALIVYAEPNWIWFSNLGYGNDDISFPRQEFEGQRANKNH